MVDPALLAAGTVPEHHAATGRAVFRRPGQRDLRTATHDQHGMRPVDGRVGVEHFGELVLAVLAFLEQLAVRIGGHVQARAQRGHHVRLARQLLAVELVVTRVVVEGVHREARAAAHLVVAGGADEGQRSALGGVVELHRLLLARRITRDQGTVMHVHRHQATTRRELAVHQILRPALQVGFGHLSAGAQTAGLAVGQHELLPAVAGIDDIALGLRHHGSARNTLRGRQQRLGGVALDVVGVDLRSRQTRTHVDPAMGIHRDGARILRPRLLGQLAVILQ